MYDKAGRMGSCCCSEEKGDGEVVDKGNLHVDRGSSTPPQKNTMREPLMADSLGGSSSQTHTHSTPQQDPFSVPFGHMRGKSGLQDWLLSINIPAEDALTYAQKLKADGFDTVVLYKHCQCFMASFSKRNNC